MDYYNNEALEVILNHQKVANQNISTLNDNQKYINENLVEFINVFKGFIDDLKKENKLLKQDLNLVKSVFALDKKVVEQNISIEDKKIVEILKKPIYFLRIHKHPRYGAMHKCGSYETIADLVKSSKHEILSIHSIGEYTYTSIIKKLAKYNLYIGMDISKYEPYL
jgi:DNA-directed RNA polymerase alpha subunit